MKVLIAVDTIPYTSETFVLNHIKGLIDAGIEVKICAFNKPSDQKIHPVFNEYNLNGIITYKPVLPAGLISRIFKGIGIFLKSAVVYPAAAFRSINFFKYGVNAIKLIYLYEMSVFVSKEKFDVVHCHFGTMAKKVAFYQDWGILPYPLITTFHGYDIDTPSIRADKLFYEGVKRRGCLFFVNSSYTKHRVTELGFDVNKIVTAPVSLDTSFFKKKAVSAQRDEIRTLITVARLVEFKGIEYCIRALKSVSDSTAIEFKYIIIGDGPLRNDLELLTVESGLSSKIEFAGSMDQAEIRDNLDKADVFLLTGVKSSDGRQENQGLVIQEAQSMELPVIVSDIGGVSEGIIDGETGFLTEERNVEQIAEKIKLLLTNEELRVRMGKRGRTLAESKYR